MTPTISRIKTVTVAINHRFVHILTFERSLSTQILNIANQLAMAPKETVLITGCSDDGIGYGLAAEFQRRDYHVFATARDISRMSKLQDLPNVTLLQLDVVNPDHVKAAVKTVTKVTGGTLNYLINNAGQSRFMPILDEDIDAVKALFDVHLYGPMALTKAFAPLIIKAKGTFAFTTSVSGYVSIPWMGKYILLNLMIARKLNGMTRHLFCYQAKPRDYG